MTWLKIDDGFTEHPKVIDLSDGAFRLHMEALVFASRNLTDGVITPAVLRRLPNSGMVDELADAGLWEPSDDGWAIHDFLEYNQSADQVRADRAAARERQRRAREKAAAKKAGDPTAGVGHVARHAVTRDVTDAATHAVSSASPSRPVPSLPKTSRQSHTATRPDPDDDDRYHSALDAAVDLKTAGANPDRNPTAYRAAVARTLPDEHGATIRQVLDLHPAWPPHWAAQDALGHPRTNPTPREVIDACPDCHNGLVDTGNGMAPCPACSWARNGNRTGAVT